ncbi:hypothetical protein U2A4042520136 [Corynebacterium striatum]|nr:hypothetical protein U2A4042520136 [Corynebacterium striatum]
MPFLQFPPAARKAIYTTNSIEPFNNELRKATRNRETGSSGHVFKQSCFNRVGKRSQ